MGLYVVADGCGGLAHGEKISRLLVDSFAVIWETELPRVLAAERKPYARLEALLRQWIVQIHDAAAAFGQQIGERVGSTASVLLIIDRQYFILHTGDSRIYRKRGTAWKQLTADQSLVADMLRNREISEEAAKDFPHQNVLTMCVGYFDRLQTYYAEGKLRKGDVFLLCSDGLYRGLSEQELLRATPEEVREDSAFEMRAQIPMGKAEDNISIILVQVLGG